MKVSEEKVVVELVVDEERVERYFSIVSSGGQLRASRLSRLLSGDVRHCQNKHAEESYNVQFVGIIWRKPYRLLEEIVADRTRLQEELRSFYPSEEAMPYAVRRLVGRSETFVPFSASDSEITRMMRQELDLHHKLKRKIRRCETRRNIG